MELATFPKPAAKGPPAAAANTAIMAPVVYFRIFVEP